MKIHIHKAVLVAATMASFVAAPARADESFSALQGVQAQALTPGEMQDIRGENTATIITALTAYASTSTNTTYSSTLTRLASAYSGTTLNLRYFYSRTLYRF